MGKIGSVYIPELRGIGKGENRGRKMKQAYEFDENIMIESIGIYNYALIEQTEIEMQSGLSLIHIWEFADFLKREWQQFESFKGESLPEEPKPKRPPFVPDTNLRPITGPVIDNPLPALPEIKPVVGRPSKPIVLP